MFEELTSASSSRDVLAAFMSRYSKFRPVEYFMGVVPDEGGFRVTYRLHVHTPGIVAVPARDMRPESLAALPMSQGGFLELLIADSSPKYFSELDLSMDPILHDLPRGLSTCTALPIFTGGKVEEWAIAFGRATNVTTGPTDIAQAMVTANLLGIANRNLDSLQTIARLNSQLRHQFEAVAHVQRALLPNRTPEIRGVEIASSYLPSDQAGGDSFDFLELQDGRIAILIADVSGHGAAAATIMTMMHGVGRAFLALQPSGWRADPAQVMSFVNSRLVSFSLEGNFVTAFFAILNPATGEVVACNAGHPPPRVRGAGGIREVDGPAGLPLGIVDDAEFVTFRLQLAPGEALVLYTDGITELFAPGGRMFGVAGLDRSITLAAGDPSRTVECIHAELFRHRGASTRDDDQTLVVVRYGGAPTAAQESEEA